MSKAVKKVVTGCIVGIAVGGILFGLGTYMGGSFPEGANITSLNTETFITPILIEKEGADVIKEEQVLEKLQGVNIDAAVAAVEVKMGEHYYISCEFPEDDMPEIRLDAGILKVVSREKELHANAEKERRRIVVTIPQGAELEMLSLKNSVGEILISEICAEEAAVNIGTGDAEIHNCSIGRLTIESKVGALNVADTQTRECRVWLDCGDMRISESNLGKGELKSNVGGLYMEETSAEQYEIKLGCGDIRLVNAEAPVVTAENATGEISFTLSENIEEYQINAETDIGIIYVNETEQGKSYQKGDLKEQRLTIKGKLGDIRITAKE